jgi:peptidoglycan/LPS O-acetylase OafA/YrhL
MFGIAVRSLRVIEAADLRHDGNVFNLLRLFLASAVIFSHAYALVGFRDADPSLQWLPFTISRLAVLLFFTLSGFLVTPSLVARGVGQFGVARLLRMVPGLWVMLFVTSAIVLIGFTAVPVAENAGLVRYIGRNMLLLSGAYTIDGAFAGQSYATVINGSLWTITFEVQCYLLLAVAGALGIVRRRGLLLGFWLAGIVLMLWMPVGELYRIVASWRFRSSPAC